LQQLKAELVDKRADVLALETQIAALEKRTRQQNPMGGVSVEKQRLHRAKSTEKVEEKEEAENEASTKIQQRLHFDEDDLDLFAYAKQSDAFDLALTRLQYEAQATRYIVNR